MSEIIVDELKGKTSTGDITVTSEGGAATQSLQQGLCKSWANGDGTGTVSLRDSLNCSGMVDNSAGNYTFTYTNPFSGNKKMSLNVMNSSRLSADGTTNHRIFDHSTSFIRGLYMTASHIASDCEEPMQQSFGDLA
tara:strand:+ start:1505 stop:1912 length:408 start_codon:yes stop_codon:yes gene_type:complete